MATTSLFTWSGQYVGFMDGKWLYYCNGRYLGWRDHQYLVWQADGTFLGQLVEEHYVMRNLARCYPARQTPPVPPLPHDPPLSAGSQLPQQPRPGWIDTLEAATHLPFHHELVGTWAVDGKQLSLAADGTFLWQQESNKQESGSWSVQAARLTIQEHEAKECATYLILEYSSEYLILRELSDSRRTFEIKLHRLSNRSK
ncbi:MAG: hypothetical protein RNU03_00100 [Candidatus Sedimenticola sp. (ex Thyasira tokunagai)]